MNNPQGLFTKTDNTEIISPSVMKLVSEGDTELIIG